MERENNNSNQCHSDVYQGEGRALSDTRNDENSSVIQEIQQTSGIENCVPAEYNRTSQQASEGERGQFCEEQRLLENLKSSILSCNITAAEEMRKLIVSIEERKKQIRDLLIMQKSRETNVAEAKHCNEAMDLELQISQKNIQELETKLACIQDICTDLQQHYAPVSATLEGCVKAKDGIVHYYAHIRQQIREADELYKVQNLQLRNKAECYRQQVVEEMELRKKNKILAEKMKIEMDQKIEIAAAKITTLQENCRVLDDGIRQKTAKKESLVSRKMQEFQELNEKVRNAEQKNEELTAEEETLKSHLMKLEIAQQEVTSDNDLLKNKILHLQQEIYEAGKRKQALSEEVEQIKARMVAEEVENHKHDSVLERKMTVKEEHTSRLEQCRLEIEGMDRTISELQDSCGKNQEELKTLQEELQAEQLKQETLTSEHKSEVMGMLAELELEKKKSCEFDSELQRDEQTAFELLETVKNIRALNGSVAQECEMVREDIAKTRSRTAELQGQANEGTENKQKAMEELQGVESCLQELQSSLAESNNTHEEFILKVTREECETDEELKNAQHGLQSSIVGHDCMMQETMRLVSESRQSYSQHIEMKDAALVACRNEFHDLTQQVEKTCAEKDTLETKMKDEVKALEDTVEQLEEKLSKKKADNQPQAASTPVSPLLPQSEQISSSDDPKFPRGILKSPATESVVSNKQVQFLGLSSESDISLLDEPVLPNIHMKPVTMKRPASKHDCTSYIQKRVSQEIPDSPEDFLKDLPARKFFKSRSQAIMKTRTQTVQEKHNTAYIKSKN